jgi:hypothetical protein
MDNTVFNYASTSLEQIVVLVYLWLNPTCRDGKKNVGETSGDKWLFIIDLKFVGLNIV